ncbi:T9SS type A sorting domain-containing protein [candidate division KSB1 bacterium]|nr:T9SS type A sorting domain-containing protein [candidate division KSB1 bacterium]
MKSYFPTILLILFFHFVSALFAQITIQGVITDFEDNAVSGALIEIINEQDALQVYRGLTNDSGIYFIETLFTDIHFTKTETPSDLIAIQNYPNPFNPSTIIYFKLPTASSVKITIFDLLGRVVKSFPQRFFTAGPHSVQWHAVNNQGLQVAAGVYFCHLQTDQHIRVHKMLLMDGGVGVITNKQNQSSSLTFQKSANPAVHSLFTLRVSAESFATLELDSLICKQDTTINAQISKIESATIGPEGGAILVPGCEMNIPQGAFKSVHNISIHRAYEKNPFGENGITDVFNLSGLPDSTTSPIKIKIKYSGTLSKETYLTIGQEIYQPLVGETHRTYNYLESSDSSGYLISELDWRSAESALNSYRLARQSVSTSTTVSAATDMIINKMDDLMTISSPAAYLETVKGHIQSAVANLKALGYHQYDKYFNKIVFNVCPVEDNNSGICAYPSHIIDFGVFKFDKKLPLTITVDQKKINSPVFPADLHSSLYSAIQGEYAPISYTKKKEDDENLQNNLWLHTAINSWAGVISGIRPPLRFFLNTRASLYARGLSPSVSDFNFADQMDFGSGMSSLFDYLDVAYNNNTEIIINFYDQITLKKPLYHLSSLIESIGMPVFEWYPGYINGYITGRSFRFDFSELTAMVRGEWTIADKNDTSHIFSKAAESEFSDISAKLYKINCLYENISGKVELHLSTLSDDVSVVNRNLYLYAFNNNQFVEIAHSDGTPLVVSNMKSFFDQRKSLYCAVVNSKYTEGSFDGKSEILLQCKMKEKSSSLNNCRVKIYVEHHYDGTSGAYSATYTTSWSATGTWNDTGFTAIIDEWLTPVSHQTGKIEIGVDLEAGTVTSFRAEKTNDYTNSDESATWTCAGVGPLPLTMDDWNEFIIFSIDGEAISSVLQEFTYNWESGDASSSLVGYTVHPDSRIAIEFDNY